MLVLLIIYVFSIISQSVGCVFANNENVEKSYTDSYYCSENEDNGVKISSRFMELFLARKKTDTKVLLIASGSAFGLTIYEPFVSGSPENFSRDHGDTASAPGKFCQNRKKPGGICQNMTAGVQIFQP